MEHDADGVQVELGAQALEDVERDLRDRRVFHVYAYEVAAARGLFDDGARVSVREFRVNRESELRELYRDVRLDSGLVNARENGFVLAHLSFGLLAARHRLVEVVEGGRAADGVQVAYGANGRLDVFARDEARRHLLEGPELRREVFQPLLARKEKECASGNHRLVRQSVPPISSGVILKTPHNRCCGMLQRAFTARLALPTPTGDSTDACV